MTPLFRVLTLIANYILFFLGLLLIIIAIITWIAGSIELAAVDISLNPYAGFGLGILSLFFFNISAKYVGKDV